MSLHGDGARQGQVSLLRRPQRLNLSCTQGLQMDEVVGNQEGQEDGKEGGPDKRFMGMEQEEQDAFSPRSTDSQPFDI
eukprot:767684-Hanusia_phi.AAC.2